MVKGSLASTSTSVGVPLLLCLSTAQLHPRGRGQEQHAQSERYRGGMPPPHHPQDFARDTREMVTLFLPREYPSKKILCRAASSVFIFRTLVAFVPTRCCHSSPALRS